MKNGTNNFFMNTNINDLFHFKKYSTIIRHKLLTFSFTYKTTV